MLSFANVLFPDSNELIGPIVSYNSMWHFVRNLKRSLNLETVILFRNFKSSPLIWKDDRVVTNQSYRKVLTLCQSNQRQCPIDNVVDNWISLPRVWPHQLGAMLTKYGKTKTHSVPKFYFATKSKIMNFFQFLPFLLEETISSEYWKNCFSEDNLYLLEETAYTVTHKFEK